MSNEPTLDELRREIDRIDDAIHDLIMQRAEVVGRVGLLKRSRSGSLIRPAREAEIVRRLTQRHKGEIKKAVIVRMWRELISAMLAIEGPQAVAVYQPARGAGYLELARDHYGAYTPMIPVATPVQVVHEIAGGRATVGILPMPDGPEDGDEPWWVSLAGDRPQMPKVIARLPFCGPGPGRGEDIEAFAIARVPNEPTGYDRSWLSLESQADASRTRLRSVLASAGLEATAILASRARDESWLHLVEISGHIAAGDRRLARVVEQSDLVERAVVVGGYAVPLSPEDLGE